MLLFLFCIGFGPYGQTSLKAKDLHNTDVAKFAGTAERKMGVKEMMSTQSRSIPSDKHQGDSVPGLQHLSACHTASKQKARQQGQGPFQPSLSGPPVVQAPANHTGLLKCSTLATNSNWALQVDKHDVT
jgi:hypothetical protein